MLLSELGEEAKPLAGGQSLLPILKMRMDEPSDLVDIGRLNDLNYIRADEGQIHIGALCTHARIARSSIGDTIDRGAGKPIDESFRQRCINI